MLVDKILNYMATYPHVGKMIKLQLKAQGRSAVWLAAQLNYGTDNIYKILQRDHLSTDVLWKVCGVLDHDFFKEISQCISGE